MAETPIMTPKEAILTAIEQLPVSKLPDLLEFIHRLHDAPSEEELCGALMSESSLAKDWLLPEENEAWQDL
jgi:hypothetical protein